MINGNSGILRKTDEQQLQKELRMQKNLRVLHAERDFGLPYSISYFRQYRPEMVEQKWEKDLNKLKSILNQYESEMPKNRGTV